MKTITKIVVTGGPCAGKTTALSWIQQKFNKIGYGVLFVSEAATDLITSGIAPWTLDSGYDFQKSIISLQRAKEKVVEMSAEALKGYDKVLIVCDRGVMDNKAYLSEDEFQRLLKEYGLSEIEIRDSYDAVFHLVTAANGAEEYYTLSNNKARTETIESAIAVDQKTVAAWTGHPHLRIIDNSTDFSTKIKRLINEISSFLGEPTTFEIERKFLVEYPDLKKLQSTCACKKSEIIQTYLNSANGDEVRIRQRGSLNHYTYTKTIKKKIKANGIKRIEIESRIDKDEYLTLLMDADQTKRQIRKDRYCFVFNNQYFELDIYPFWKDKAIVEIELASEKTKVDFPDFIKVIKEVTDDESFKNSSIAKIK